MDEVKSATPVSEITAVSATVKCLTVPIRASDAGALDALTLDCNIIADVESGNVTFNIPDRNAAIAVRLDELLEIMAQAIVLAHQREELEGEDQDQGVGQEAGAEEGAADE